MADEILDHAIAELNDVNEFRPKVTPNLSERTLNNFSKSLKCLP